MFRVRVRVRVRINESPVDVFECLGPFEFSILLRFERRVLGLGLGLGYGVKLR